MKKRNAALTVRQILNAPSDKALFDLLCAELERCFPVKLKDDLDLFVERAKPLPPGLRAMAATYELDLSVALDDLGWHFANWHHKPYCKETSRGLRQLEATEAAEIFDQAYSIVLPHWDAIGDMLAEDFSVFSEWYYESPLSKLLLPLNIRLYALWEQGKDFSLMSYWLTYARKHPENVANVSGCN